MDDMIEQTSTDRYVDYINENILSKTDYALLQASYTTEDKAYAKGVLNALHKAAVEVYGTEYFDGFEEDEYVLLPGIVCGKNTGNLCISILGIDLLSSGEHCDTIFLTKDGCQPSFVEDRAEEITNFISTTYGVYDYAYTLGIENDIHVDFENLPAAIAEMLNTFEDYEFTPTEPKNVFDNANEKEDFER